MACREMDDLLGVTIRLLVRASRLDMGALRVGEAGRLYTRASVGLDEEVSARFSSPCADAVAPSFQAISLTDPRVSDTMRALGAERAYWLDMSHEGLPIGACFGSRDVAELAADRIEHLESLGKLASEAIGRCHELQVIDDRLRSREQGLANVAHDLKNAINAVALSAAVLELKLDANSPQQSILERITRNTRRATHMLESLVSSAQIDAGQLALTWEFLDPAELVLAVAEAQQDAGLGQGVIMATDLEPALAPVRADRERLHEVFENLVGNALKFTGSGGTITIGAASRADDVEFSVKDTGSGISKEGLERMFERYFRERPEDRNGSGLGLSICKGIVEAHGGRIWAESSVGVGTAVRFTLPKVAEEPVTESSPRANVLIVDDRRENRMALEAILESQGHRILTAASGHEALRCALKEELSVVLLDIEMPDMSGFETASHLRLVKRTQSIPIVFITAYGQDPERIHRAYAAGGVDYLVKPLDPEIVRRKVAVFAELGRKRARRDSERPG